MCVCVCVVIYLGVKTRCAWAIIRFWFSVPQIKVTPGRIGTFQRRTRFDLRFDVVKPNANAVLAQGWAITHETPVPLDIEPERVVLWVYGVQCVHGCVGV